MCTVYVQTMTKVDNQRLDKRYMYTLIRNLTSKTA